MLNKITFEEIEKLSPSKYTLIDFRTESEHQHATIPGAVNIPILRDKERQEVGTLYVSGKIDEAKQRGIEAVAARLPLIYKDIQKLQRESENLFGFCSRGGYRSKVIVETLHALDVNISKIEGGYKGYRRHVNEYLPKIFAGLKLVVLHGKTGSGKTVLLQELKALGANVIDLEKYANHRGSLLGGISLGIQNSQKQFEALLYNEIYKHPGETFFIEGESKRIGKVLLPEPIFEALRSGIKLYIDTPIERRIEYIMNDYVHDNDEELITSLSLLKNLVSAERLESYRQMIRMKNYVDVIEDLMIRYYDSCYALNHDYVEEVKNLDEKQTAEYLMEKYYH